MLCDANVTSRPKSLLSLPHSVFAFPFPLQGCLRLRAEEHKKADQYANFAYAPVHGLLTLTSLHFAGEISGSRYCSE